MIKTLHNPNAYTSISAAKRNKFVNFQFTAMEEDFTIPVSRISAFGPSPLVSIGFPGLASRWRRHYRRTDAGMVDSMMLYNGCHSGIYRHDRKAAYTALQHWRTIL
ncbi:hypothetical protein V1477_012001 [Vespula maculifrons]|uniref:Uncharacterized protein n=1 Tax=Vespula maculifrons TaxID=7453 RepID=A0ABD2C0S8_VESMC